MSITLPGSAKGARTGVITLGRRQWAVGLSWQLAETREIAVRRAKEQAARVGNNLYCIHTAPDGTYEFATASDLRDQKSGMNALASALVSAKPPGAMSATWIAIFDLPDGRYYLVAARNGAIDPQSDAIFDTIDDAINRINDIDPDNDWPLYADPRHQLAGAKEWAFDQAIREGRPTARLKIVDPSGIIKAWAFRVCALGIIGVIGYYAYQWTTAPIVQQQMPKKVVVPPPPWANKESGVEAAQLCLRAMPVLPVDGPGWKRVAATCAGGVISAQFARTGTVDKSATPISWFVQTIAAAGWPREAIVTTDKEPNKITVSLPAPLSRTIWKEKIQTTPVEQITRRLASTYDTLLVVPKFTPGKGQFFKTAQITLTTTAPPDYLFKPLQNIQGLTLSKMTYDGKKYETTFEYHIAEPLPPGKDYEHQPPPPVRIVSRKYADFYAQRMGE